MTTLRSDDLPRPLQRPALDTIEERDLDLLLVLSICTLPAFARVIVKATMQSDDATVLGAWRGVVSHLGETDILILLSDEQRGRTAILIENKIDASFQPNQALRYRQRGEEGIQEGLWDGYRTCLCGPTKYLGDDAGALWDVTLRFEDLADALEPVATRGSVAAFVLRALGQAITKFEKGGFISNQAATAFWRKYQSLCFEGHRDLGMTPLQPLQSKNEPWPQFAKGVLPNDIRLEHKAKRGCVDMTFQKRDVADVQAKLAHLLKPGLSVVRTRPSVALRRSVQPIQFSEPFEEQEDKMREAFGAAQELLEMWPQIRGALGYW